MTSANRLIHPPPIAFRSVHHYDAIMKLSVLSFCLALSSLSGSSLAFVSHVPADVSAGRHGTILAAKPTTMDEILAKFPEDKPVLVNFYDGNTENAIKNDIVQAKKMLEGRATLVSVKQQDYPEIAKLWDADARSPSMILFKDGKPVSRLYETTDYLDIISKMSKFFDD